MLCSKCKKNQATKTYEQWTENGKKEPVYYCLPCYQKAIFQQESKRETQRTSCPYCAASVTEIKRRGIVGCSYCYQTLVTTLYPMVKKFQGENFHKGKVPYANKEQKRMHRERELDALAERFYAENDDKSAGKYEEQLSRLLEGGEEEYVWSNHHLSNPL